MTSTQHFICTNYVSQQLHAGRCVTVTGISADTPIPDDWLPFLRPAPLGPMTDVFVMDAAARAREERETRENWARTMTPPQTYRREELTARMGVTDEALNEIIDWLSAPRRGTSRSELAGHLVYETNGYFERTGSHETFPAPAWDRWIERASRVLGVEFPIKRKAVKR